MELADRLSTLTQDQQIRVVERVFQKLLMAFGNQMQAKWQGIDMQTVYLDWAEALQDCSLGAINHAISVSKEDAHPPSQGAFLSHCKSYRPPLIETRIERKSSVPQDEALRRIAEIKETLAAKMRMNND